MANLLSAVSNLVNNPIFNLVEYYSGPNRLTNAGKALETYIKELFADANNLDSTQEKEAAFEATFSYLGNMNNPPDIILRGGDAIEVKKIQSKNAQIALNSSYPKAHLDSDSQYISQACRNCEEWEQKDIIYVIGYIDDNTLRSLFLCYGHNYAASRDTYERLFNGISEGIRAIPGYEFSPTQELARVNQVDPLGITSLRVRGMWHIQNPISVYDYLYNYNNNAEFQLICLIDNNKYYSFPDEDWVLIEDIQDERFNISNIRIRVPDNPAQSVDGKLITFVI